MTNDYESGKPHSRWRRGVFLKTIPLVLLSFFLTTLSWSQDVVQLGSGTGTSAYFPLNYNWGYNYTQTIYTAAEMTAQGAVAGQISKIKYKPTASVATTNWKDWVIYMGNTTKASFTSTTDWVSIGSMTQVFAGEIPSNVTANQWMEITLSTPFNWDGTSNIVVAVDENTSTYGSTPSWAGYTLAPSSGNKGIYYYSDGTNPNPASPPAASGRSNTVAQIQFAATLLPPCSGTPNGGSLAINPSSGAGRGIGLNATGFETGRGISGVWETSINGAAWFPQTLTEPTLSVNLPESVQQGDTWKFRYALKCSFSDSTGYSNEVSYTVDYTNCIPTTTGNTGHIINFVANGGGSQVINNTASGPGQTSGYSNFNTQIVDVTPTTNMTYSVKMTGSNSSGVKIWIDWNDDGNFDSSEIVYQSTTSKNLHEGSILIPVNAIEGNKRMRVGAASSTAAGPNGPCYHNGNGEFEDYTINVIPLPICSGTPEGGTASLNPTSGNPGSTFTATATGTTLADGIEYQWQKNVGGWTDIAGATSPTSTITAETGAVGTATNYRLKVTCTNSGSSAYSNEVTHTLVLVYCTPPSPSFFGIYWIESVSTSGAVANFSNLNTGESPSGYVNYSDSHEVEVMPNMNFTLTIDNKNGATPGLTVWIDWNQNGVFETSEEVYYTTSGTSSSLNTYNISVNVPASAALGKTGMRIRNYGSSGRTPCGSASYGEVEDYGVLVSPISGCTGTPDGGTAALSVSQGGPNSSYTVSATGYENAADLEFQWQSNINEAGWNNEGPVTNSYSDFNATATATIGDTIEWRLRVKCLNSGLEDFSTVVVFNVLSECAGTPDGGVATAGQTSGQSESVFVFSVAGQSTGELGLTGVWEYSFNNGTTWTTTTWDDSTVGVTVKAAHKNVFSMRFAVTCANSGIKSYSNVATSLVLATNCIPTYTDGCSLDDYIKSFSLTGETSNLSRINGSCTGGTYLDKKSESADVVSGATYNGSISAGTTGDRMTIWIDFDGDGGFSEDEIVAFSMTGISNGATPTPFSITIPSTVPVGVYTMRVLLAWSSSNTKFTDACGAYGYGQTIDYSISVGSPGYVYENGAWSQDPSTATASDDITIVNGAVTVGSITGKNVTVNAGASLDVTGILNVHGDLTINGNLTFKSSATGNGELGVINGTITGNATVEHHMRDRRSYRMVSPAVTTSTSIRTNWQEGGATPAGYGTHITGSTTGANGFDATQTGNASMWTVDMAAQQFVPVTNTNVDNLEAGKAYLMFIRGDRNVDLNSNDSHSATTLRATGQLHKGDKVQTFTSPAAGAFIMVGNPYQSAVNVNTLATTNATNINSGHYYTYDVGQGDHGGYVTVSLPSGINGASSPVNQYLQAGQAAQFATLSAGASSVTFTEGVKAPGNFAFNNAGGNGFGEENMINVQLFTAANFANGGRTHDAVTLMFDDSYSNAITAADAVKPMNFRENLGVESNGTYLSIEKREMPIASEVYQLFTSGYTHNSYTFNVEVNGLSNHIFYLDDSYTGSSRLLSAGETAYHFEVDSNEESRVADRFSIRVESRLGVEENVLSGIRLFPNPINAETFYIHAPKLNGEQVEVSIADLTGRQIFNSNLSCTSSKITVNVNETLASGVYLVTVKFAGEAQTYRLVRE